MQPSIQEKCLVISLKAQGKMQLLISNNSNRNNAQRSSYRKEYGHHMDKWCLFNLGIQSVVDRVLNKKKKSRRKKLTDSIVGD